ncbi:FkbM family methyltransferase [Synoicihabitans lomoniglobus]|uniref:FkbM family methyltransferase n=1 Tax=Synoicihabitans lomoniglobus TaxID=2909285 RepID=A0AAF0CQT9_9BACT|nr:FkbM family methyltransferase [Opitutaceae bacterium LMO-M01]WED66348.1 FkbM family methyltransferase [Opitutaceae bacterium LMO-M01]
MIKIINKLLGIFKVEVRRAQARPLKVLQGLLENQSRPIILDIGAHHGGSVRDYRQHFPDATIHAFEPSPEIYNILKKSTASDPSVSAHQLALSDQVGQLDFHLNRDSFTNSLLQIDDLAGDAWGDDVYRAKSVKSVDVSTLDTLCSQGVFDRITILKIDVQGAELKVLRGGKGLFENGKVGMVYCEIVLVPTYQGQGDYIEILDFMNGHGYSLYGIYDPWRKGNRLLQFDALFVNSRDFI